MAKKFAPKFSDIKEEVEELEESEEGRFHQIRYEQLENMTDRGVLIKFSIKDYEDETEWYKTGGKTWIPFSQIRHLEGELYFSDFILGQKGISTK